MIFVTIGTSLPFDRLLRTFEALDLGEQVVVQCGSRGCRPAGAVCLGPMPYEILVDHVRRARVVVTHAGAGSVLTCLLNGKKPVVVPRLRIHHEAVDDHQVEFGHRLSDVGLVTLVGDPSELASVLRAESSKATPVAPDQRLIDELQRYISSCVTECGRNREGHASMDIRTRLSRVFGGRP